MRRAFALPLVVVLALIVGIAAATLLQLHSATTLAVNRQVADYRLHHSSVSIRDLLDGWLLTAQGRVHERLGADNLAFELIAASGSVVRVYLADAQGSVLRDLSTQSERDAAFLQRIIDELGSARPAPGEEFFRTVGPAAVSVNSAPEAVLTAVVASLGNPRAAASFSREIVSSRREKWLTKADITKALTDADIKDEQARTLETLLTDTPSIWRVVVETHRSRLDRDPVGREGGIVQVPAGGTVPGQSPTMVVRWENLAQ